MAAGYMLANPSALPGIGTEIISAPRQLLAREISVNDLSPWPATIDGTLSRDCTNPTTTRTDVLRDGLPMGKVTATGKWAPSILGTSAAALGTSATTLLVAAPVAAELARRVGATGTFKLIGPPSTAGTVATATVTYSAIGSGSGANCVQTLTWTSQPSAGTFRLTFTKADGSYVTTSALAYGATLATVQAAIDIALGVASACVVTGTTYAYQTMIFTFSGTGYTLLPQPLIIVDDTSLTQATAGETVTMTTIGVPNAGAITISATGVAFVAGSLICPTDGSENIRTLFKSLDNTGVSDLNALLASIDVIYPALLIGGAIRTGYMLFYTGNDASIQAYFKSQLRTYGGKWVFDDDYIPVS